MCVYSTCSKESSYIDIKKSCYPNAVKYGHEQFTPKNHKTAMNSTFFFLGKNILLTESKPALSIQVIGRRD